jgi:hypothetical protein
MYLMKTSKTDRHPAGTGSLARRAASRAITSRMTLAIHIIATWRVMERSSPNT